MKTLKQLATTLDKIVEYLDKYQNEKSKQTIFNTMK